MLLNLRQYSRPADDGSQDGLAVALQLLSRPDVHTVPLAGGVSLIGSGDPAIEAVVDLQALGLTEISLAPNLGALSAQAMVTRAQLASLKASDAQASSHSTKASPLGIIALSPAESSLKQGETVTLSLVVLGLRDATGLEVVLTHDPGLEVLDASAGLLLTLDGAAIGVERALEAGRTRVKLTRPTGVSGSGAVLTLTLRGARAGSGALSIESLVVQGPGGVERPLSTTTARVVVNP